MTIPRSFSLASFGIFIVMGAIQALYGPLIPDLRNSYTLSAASAGLIMSAHFTGATLGIFGFGLIARKLAYKWPIVISAGLLSLSCLTLSVSSSWLITLGLCLVLGLAYGGLTAGINELFAFGFQQRGAAMLNLVNAAFGVGASLGPLVLVVTGTVSFSLSFLWLGCISLALVIPLLSNSWQGQIKPREGHATAANSSLNLVFAFSLIIFIYGLLEAGASAWQVTHLSELGFSSRTANSLKASFWALFMLGRLITAPLTLRFKPRHIVISVLLGVVIVMVSASFITIDALIYPLAGLLFAPIYTCVLAWFGEVGSHRPGAAAPIMAAGLFGTVLSPPAIGLAIGWQSALVLPGILALFALLALIVVVLTQRLVKASR